MPAITAEDLPGIVIPCDCCSMHGGKPAKAQDHVLHKQ